MTELLTAFGWFMFSYFGVVFALAVFSAIVSD